MEIGILSELQMNWSRLNWIPSVSCPLMDWSAQYARFRIQKSNSINDDAMLRHKWEANVCMGRTGRHAIWVAAHSIACRVLHSFIAQKLNTTWKISIYKNLTQSMLHVSAFLLDVWVGEVREREWVIEWMSQWDCALRCMLVCIRTCQSNHYETVTMHTMSMYGINLYVSRPLSHSFFFLSWARPKGVNGFTWEVSERREKKEQSAFIWKTKRFTFRVKILNKKNFISRVKQNSKGKNVETPAVPLLWMFHRHQKHFTHSRVRIRVGFYRKFLVF